MPRLLIAASFLTLAACSVQSAEPAHRPKADSAKRLVTCTTEDGRSGYLIASGDKCVAN